MNRLNKRLDSLPLSTINLLSQIDQLNGQWIGGARLSPQVLGRLKRSVLVTSTGASTRIEGANLSDEEVEKLMRGWVEQHAIESCSNAARQQDTAKNEYGKAENERRQILALYEKMNMALTPTTFTLDATESVIDIADRLVAHVDRTKVQKTDTSNFYT